VEIPAMTAGARALPSMPITAGNVSDGTSVVVSGLISLWIMIIVAAVMTAARAENLTAFRENAPMIFSLIARERD
jgi:hypothetical protein